MEYYQRLKEIREDKDLTQKEIANIINSSQQQVYKYENGIELAQDNEKRICTLEQKVGM